MNNFKAIAIKFVSSLVLLYVILGLFYNMSFGHVFLITLVLGVVSYILGDLLILPRTNNTVATIADFGLAFIIIWTMSANIAFGPRPFFPVFIASIGVALFEVFFHTYMLSHVIEEDDRQETGHLQYQTEVSEELAPDYRDDDRKED